MTRLAYDIGTRAIQQIQEIKRAEQECGALAGDTLAMDSAEAVYGAALTSLGVDTSRLRGHGCAVMRATFLAHRGGTRRPIAMDASATRARDTMFPNADRLNKGY